MNVSTHHEVNITPLTRATVFGHKGYIAAGWDELVNQFGFPMVSKQPGAKVEWQITIHEGRKITFLTIYDLHSRHAPEDLDKWAVAGIRGVDIFTPLAKLGFYQLNEGEVLYG